MLSVYPIAATAENWVHETICSKVRSAIEALNRSDPAPAWNSGVRKELRDREALAARYESFCTAAERLSVLQRTKILHALDAQNNIPAVFDGATACPRLDTLPARIRQPTKDFFAAAFDVLKTLKIRDRQYSHIFAGLPGKCCPFCGIELFDAPGLAREDLDHYLPKHIYPFAGANLHNLVPMGGKCNSSYKLSQDVIYDDDGQRHRCFDPYGQDCANVSLLDSRPFEGNIVDFVTLPAWQIDLSGRDSDAVATWDRVFQIRRRYEGKIDAHFRDWTETFAVWCVREIGVVKTRQQVVDALDRYIRNVVQQGFVEPGHHLKRAMFEMMRQHCQGGKEAERLAAWFSDLVQHRFRDETA